MEDRKWKLEDGRWRMDDGERMADLFFFTAKTAKDAEISQRMNDGKGDDIKRMI